MQHPAIALSYPVWVDTLVDWDRAYRSDEDRMRLATHVARTNVELGTGGPFGAAIFESDSGRIVSVGMNAVVRLHNAILHGEVVAFMMAQKRLKSFTLAAAGMPSHELVTSCEPCAMCVGAIHWSGVKRIVCGAARDDATKLQFDEGPVFPESYRYLQERGVTIVRHVLRDEARAVLELYRARKGAIYNA